MIQHDGEQLGVIIEKRMLQHDGEKLGVIIDYTPKCHAEMDGEGIECFWSMSKLHCGRLPMALKRGKEKFRNSALLSMSTENVLTLERHSKFAKRACRNIVNHNILDNKLNVPSGKKKFSLIEKITFERKSHRNAKDFAHKLVNDIA